MAKIRITCPKCGRTLGDTDKSIDCRINCHSCRKAVEIRMQVASFMDYLTKTKQEESNDKSE